LRGKKKNAGNKFPADSGLIRSFSYSDRQFYKFTIIIQLEVFKIKYHFSKISFELIRQKLYASGINEQSRNPDFAEIKCIFESNIFITE
jgi:hypothetical protein